MSIAKNQPRLIVLRWNRGFSQTLGMAILNSLPRTVKNCVRIRKPILFGQEFINALATDNEDFAFIGNAYVRS